MTVITVAHRGEVLGDPLLPTSTTGGGVGNTLPQLILQYSNTNFVYGPEEAYCRTTSRLVRVTVREAKSKDQNYEDH